MLKKSICRICKRRCGIVVEIDDNHIVRVTGDAENERSRGYICPKGKAIPDTVHSSGRLLYPMKRNGDGWQRISWDDAFSEIAEKLYAVRSKYGPESLDIFTGEATLNERLSLYFERFGHIYGTPNHRTGGICHTVKLISNKLVYGTLLHPDYERSRCIVLWGTNLDTAEPLNAIKVRNARKNGAKLIVIDPALTLMAKLADLHLRVRPGTDGALALGMMNVLISEGLVDMPFIEKWTVGYSQLARRRVGSQILRHRNEIHSTKRTVPRFFPDNLWIHRAVPQGRLSRFNLGPHSHVFLTAQPKHNVSQRKTRPHQDQRKCSTFDDRNCLSRSRHFNRPFF